MKLWGILSGVLDFGVKLWGSIKGTGAKPTMTDLLPLVVGNILPAVEKAISYQNLDSQEKVDAWLATLDAATGEEASAADVLRDLPADKEEQLFDHLLEVARIYAYSKIGVEGYTVEAPTE